MHRKRNANWRKKKISEFYNSPKKCPREKLTTKKGRSHDVDQILTKRSHLWSCRGSWSKAEGPTMSILITLGLSIASFCCYPRLNWHSLAIGCSHVQLVEQNLNWQMNHQWKCRLGLRRLCGGLCRLCGGRVAQAMCWFLVHFISTPWSNLQFLQDFKQSWNSQVGPE